MTKANNPTRVAPKRGKAKEAEVVVEEVPAEVIEAAEEVPAEEAPAEEVPVEEAPAEEATAEEATAEEATAEEATAEEDYVLVEAPDAAEIEEPPPAEKLPVNSPQPHEPQLPPTPPTVAAVSVAIPEEEGAVAESVLAQATAAAVAAAEAATESVAGAATAKTASDPSQPNDRDVILGEGSAGHKTNLLLQDVIRLHRILWKLHDKPLPTTAEQVQGMASHIISIVKQGKQLELAGLKDVPKPFMKSEGRFFGKDAVTGMWKVLDDAELNTIMTEIMLDEFKVDDLGPLTESPYKDLKEWMTKVVASPATDFLPEAKDAILLPVDQDAEKMYESQQGNKTLFHLASQLVTSHTNSPDKRVEAALHIMMGLDETLESMESASKSMMADQSTTTKMARFLIRTVRDDRSVAWNLLDPASAAEFTVIFVFEVFLEKEIHIIDSNMSSSLYASLAGVGGTDMDEDDMDNMGKPSTVPILEPTDHDVLFGRGGMTNSHPGNRRFRDIIALHRPDYIRAIKLDKPGVARKIVKAIRLGNPPGRFLKKADDGMYYDVGDRTAAEKTSQGLRERTNAEKRQRSALREALRIRKEDMVEDDDDEADDGDGDGLSKKRAKSEAAAAIPTLNYVGTNLPVPLSLNMKDASASVKVTASRAKKVKEGKASSVIEELNCEGLPPNAVDEEGNVLVTDYDILCGRGGLTNHHKGNKRFRDIVALHRPDYVRAPKIQKPSVARVIVRAIRNGDPPGRFLRKDEKLGKWVDIGDKKAAEKTSQALREKPGDERDQAIPVKTGVGVILPSPAKYLGGFAGVVLPEALIPVVAAPLETSGKADAEEGKSEEKTGDEKSEEKTGDEKSDEKTGDEKSEEKTGDEKSEEKTGDGKSEEKTGDSKAEEPNAESILTESV